MARVLPLSSRMLLGVRYDRFSSRLIAQFSEDAYYSYDSVPSEVVLDVLFADSHGQAFDRLVKKGGFSYQRITRTEALAD